MCPIADDKGIIFFFFPPPLPPTQEEALPPYIPNPLLQKFLLLTADSTGKLDTQQLDLGYRVQRSKQSCKDFFYLAKSLLEMENFLLKSFLFEKCAGTDTTENSISHGTAAMAFFFYSQYCETVQITFTRTNITLQIKLWQSAFIF